MKSFLSISFALSVCLSAWSQHDPSGIWQAIDDVQGKATSHIEIFEKDGKLHGKVVKILAEPETIVCGACKGKKKDRPILGMEVLWDLKAHGRSWKGGRIMDPENGKTYKCKIQLDKEDILEVRGYVGLPALGRTQRWHRLK